MNIESQRRYRTYLLVLVYLIVMICVVRARGLRGLGYAAAHRVGMALVLILSLLVAIVVFGTI